MISQYDKDNIHRIMAGEGTWFTAQLLRLMQKADPANLKRLEMGFPEEVKLYKVWLEDKLETFS